jgi:hypothetical protein
MVLEFCDIHDLKIVKAKAIGIAIMFDNDALPKNLPEVYHRGKILSKPTVLSIPKSIIKAALGEELAHAAILSSARVMPTRLLKTGFQFRYPYLELALRHTLGKSYLCR